MYETVSAALKDDKVLPGAILRQGTMQEAEVTQLQAGVKLGFIQARASLARHFVLNVPQGATVKEAYIIEASCGEVWGLTHEDAAEVDQFLKRQGV